MEIETQYNSSCTDEADRELLRRYQAGDETAFDELFRTHANFFRKCVRIVLSRVSWVHWDDVEREVHMAFYLAAKKFDLSREGSFDGYAYKSAMKAFDSGEVRIAKRTLYDNYSRADESHDKLSKELDRTPTYKELSDDTGLTVRQIKTAITAVAAFPIPLEEAEGVSASADPYKMRLLSEAMATLSPHEADLFISHDLFGETFPEIANRIGINVDTVRQRHARARKKLRRIMQDEGKRKDGT
jgi:RNA polymerase sporulation-specific sigma factor